MESSLNIFTEQQRKAAEKSILLGIPFALFADKNVREFTFLAGTSSISSEQISSDMHDSEMSEEENSSRVTPKEAFIIGFYDHEEIPIAITGSISIEELLSMKSFDNSLYDGGAVIPSEKSTNRIIYNAQIFTIKNRLKAIPGGGKVVLSRVIVLKSDKSPVDVAEEYFYQNPGAFRALYFHPDTGLWIVATPELLIEYNKNSKHLSTMALAGTRKVDSEGDWDRKNLKEHQIVVKYIVNTLKVHEINCTWLQKEEILKAGTVEHLYTPIEADTEISQEKMTDLLKDLSPTPAVGGYPKDIALSLINNLELHNRYCYSGWIGFEKNDKICLFVNLRSSLVTPLHVNESNSQVYLYNVYAGGGILPQSNADTEWEETEMKSQNLRNIIRGEELL